MSSRKHLNQGKKYKEIRFTVILLVIWKYTYVCIYIHTYTYIYISYIHIHILYTYTAYPCISSCVISSVAGKSIDDSWRPHPRFNQRLLSIRGCTRPPRWEKWHFCLHISYVHLYQHLNLDLCIFRFISLIHLYIYHNSISIPILNV